MIFGDEEATQAVMATDDVETQQSVGRKTKGYLPATWNGMRQIIAFEGLMAKFSQNEELKQQLLETGNKCNLRKIICLHLNRGQNPRQATRCCGGRKGEFSDCLQRNM